MRIEYGEGGTCYYSGYPNSRLAVDAESQLGSLDFDVDGEPDVIRSDREMFYRLASFPSFELAGDWVHVTIQTTDGVDDLLRFSAFGPLSFSLLRPGPLVDPIEELEALRSQADAEEEPTQSELRFEVDQQGRIVEATLPADGPEGDSLVLTPIYSGTASAPSLPTAGVTEFASLPVATVLLSSQVLDPACDPSAGSDAMEAERQCIVDVTGGTSVEAWLQAHQDDPALLC